MGAIMNPKLTFDSFKAFSMSMIVGFDHLNHHYFEITSIVKDW